MKSKGFTIHLAKSAILPDETKKRSKCLSSKAIPSSQRPNPRNSLKMTIESSIPIFPKLRKSPSKMRILIRGEEELEAINCTNRRCSGILGRIKTQCKGKWFNSCLKSQAVSRILEDRSEVKPNLDKIQILKRWALRSGHPPAYTGKKGKISDQTS